MKRRSIVMIMICLISVCILAGCKKETSPDNAGKTEKEETVAEDKKQDVKEETDEKKPDERPEKKAEIDTAAAAESLKKMSDAISGFLWASMMKESGYNFMGPGDIRLSMSDEDKIRASVLACEGDKVIDSTFVLGMGGFSEDKNADDGPDGDGFHGISVSKNDVENKCYDLFGTKPPWDDLPPGPECDLYDAVKYSKGEDTYALIVERVVETETALKNQECTVTERDGKYIGEVNMFWGYWGELEQKPGYSNYVATYTLEPDDGSQYGMVITSIDIKRKEEATDYKAMYQPVTDEILDVIDYGYNIDREYAYVGSGLVEKINYPGDADLHEAVGFILEDLSGDDVPELLIGCDENYSGSDPVSIIYSIFTIKDDKVFPVVQCWTRSSYQYMGDRHFYYRGSGGAAITLVGENHLSNDGTEVLWDDFYFTDEKENGEIGVYHNKTGMFDAKESEEPGITETQFSKIMDDYEKRCEPITWTPIGKY